MMDVAMECPGEWTCEDIEMIAASDMEWYDYNGNGAIDYDDIDPEHMDMLNDMCDMNGDGMVDACEYH
jgi:hypothetical protein